MPEPRIIRKHSNRRLWDPLRRGYLVLDDIHDLVVTGTEFNVIDNDRADVTRSELLQVIIAQERGADTSMTTEFLLQTIRSHAESPSGMTATFLEQTLRLLHDLSGKRKIPGMAADNSTIARRLAEANYKRWRSVARQIRQVLANAISQDNSPPRPLRKLIGLLPTQRPERRLKRSPRPAGVMTRRS
jgi:polyhydroxyalkanoate synthesis repressor PhaR